MARTPRYPSNPPPPEATNAPDMPPRGVAVEKAVGAAPLPADRKVMQAMGNFGSEAIGGSPDDTLREMQMPNAKAEAGSLLESDDDSESEGTVSPQSLDQKFLKLAAEAEMQSRTFMEMSNRDAWQRSYRAFRNEHNTGSKFHSKEWQGRSKLFRPKTKTKVRKTMATAASALFSTADVVKIGAGDDADDMQRASAAIKQELINYRLSRQSQKAAVPWFLVSMGAVQDADIVGVCCSKQSWLHKIRESDEIEQPDDEETEFGNGTTMIVTPQPRNKQIVELDRPDICLYPPENVLVDPAAGWTNPAQNGAFLILRMPMHVDDVMEMMEGSPYSKIQWCEVSREQLQQNSQSSYDTEGIRRAREGGKDRIQDAGRMGNGYWNIVWVHECFIRCRGEDYHFYSVGSTMYLSAPTPVREVYPEQGGDRPVCLGYGQIESHRINPMSAVEAMQPLQMEANDVANLRLDQLKQVVLPVAKVKRGSDVDTETLKRRGPNTTVFMRNPDTDLIWDRPPDVPASAYQEQSLINADIDDLSGQFSGGSVQTNRQLNETVGGMQLLNGSANAQSEFDLRVWVETWVEPVIAMIVKLEEYYESDATILALAGKRAKLIEKFGITEINDDLMDRQVTTTVNVGVGASDPMQRLTKFKAASEIAGALIGPGVQSGEVKIKYAEVVDEVFGAAGYSDAGQRFVDIVDPTQQPPKQDPAMAEVDRKAQEGAAKLKSEQDYRMAQLQSVHDLEMEKIASNERIASANDASKITAAEVTAKGAVAGKIAGSVVQATTAAHTAEMGHQNALALGHQKGVHGLLMGEQKGQQAADQLQAKGDQAIEQSHIAGMQAEDQARLGAELNPPEPAAGAPAADAAAPPKWAVENAKLMQSIFDELQQQKSQLQAGGMIPPPPPRAKAQIVRGPDGKATHFQIGDQIHPLERDPATGALMGVGEPQAMQPEGPPA